MAQRIAGTEARAENKDLEQDVEQDVEIDQIYSAGAPRQATLVASSSRR